MNVCLPRLMFAAPKSGSGKTLITCGFLEALKRRGMEPRSFKCGPDYIDPMFHRYVLGIPGGNLDSFFLDREALRCGLACAGADDCRAEARTARRIAVLEGVMGYYDGLGGISTSASSYEVACLTDTPVILVLDCKGASLSLAAEVRGFLSLRRDSGIGGVILNRISPMLCERLGPVIEKESGIPVFGYIPESEAYRLESRHLGLLLPEEIGDLRQRIGALAGQMEKTLDMDGLLRLAEGAAPLSCAKPRRTEIATDTEQEEEQDTGQEEEEEEGQEQESSSSQYGGGVCGGVRIGVARDEAFCFYYQENLRLMRELGAELVEFSPLHGRELPGSLDGLLLGGGYPENFAAQLSGNVSMLTSVRTAIQEGLPVLAECGGFLYLHEFLEGSDGKEYPMAGIVKAKAYRTQRLGRFGYITLTGASGRVMKGHEFHYWESEKPGEDWLAEKPAGGWSWRCMYGNGAQIFGFPHLYYPSNPSFLSEWIARCREYGSRRTFYG